LTQPAFFDLPIRSNPDGGIPLAISIQSNADDLEKVHQQGRNELLEIEAMLSSIATDKCLDCWIDCQAPKETHTLVHTKPDYFDLRQSSLRSIKFPPFLWWPFCYLCWVPFRAPCQHPALSLNRRADPDQCPHGTVLPDVLLKVYMDKKKRCDVFDLLEEDADLLSSQLAFFKWLSAPPPSAAQVPNPHRFLIAFWKIRARLL
jgi:hypothetical protein